MNHFEVSSTLLFFFIFTRVRKNRYCKVSVTFKKITLFFKSRPCICVCVYFFQARIWQMRPKERMTPRTQTQPSSMPTATTHTQKKRKSISFRLQVALRSSLSSHSFPPSLHRVGTSSDSSGSFFSHFFSVLFVAVLFVFFISVWFSFAFFDNSSPATFYEQLICWRCHLL